MRIAMLAGISWLQTLTTPLLTIFGKGIAVRDLILIAGGLFLLVKATTELHARLEVAESTSSANRGTPAVFWQAIVQIVILDLVFSIDSVITAVGMVDHLAIMVIAVLIAIAAMMLVSGPLTRFVSAHPTVVILCLSFLLMIGFSLFAEGWGLKIPKGYLYAAIAFSVAIETLNQIATRNRVKLAALGDLRSRTSETVLRMLGGVPVEAPIADDVSSVMAAGAATDVFAPVERNMVRQVLSMAERPVRSIMTPSVNVIWLDVRDSAESLSRKVLQTGHAAYPVCRNSLDNLLGVARAPDLVSNLLDKGCIDAATLDRQPVKVSEDRSVLQMMEQLKRARAPLGIVTNSSGAMTGVVTSTDLLQVVFGAPAS